MRGGRAVGVDVAPRLLTHVLPALAALAEVMLVLVAGAAAAGAGLPADGLAFGQQALALVPPAVGRAVGGAVAVVPCVAPRALSRVVVVGVGLPPVGVILLARPPGLALLAAPLVGVVVVVVPARVGVVVRVRVVVRVVPACPRPQNRRPRPGRTAAFPWAPGGSEARTESAAQSRAWEASPRRREGRVGCGLAKRGRSIFYRLSYSGYG